MAVEIDVRNGAFARFHARHAAEGGATGRGIAARLRGADGGRRADEAARRAVAAALAGLPDGWFILNGLVIEVRPDEFVEVDHAALGPGGLAVVEALPWAGGLEGGEGAWRAGGGLVECPFTALDRRAETVLSLLSLAGLPAKRWWAAAAFPLAASVAYTGDRRRIILTRDSLGRFADALARAGEDPVWTPDEARAAALILTIQRPFLRVAGEAAWLVAADSGGGVVRLRPGVRASAGQRAMILELLARRDLTAAASDLGQLSRDEAAGVIERLKAGDVEGIRVPLRLLPLDEEARARARRPDPIRLVRRPSADGGEEWAAFIEGLDGCEAVGRTPEEAARGVEAAKLAWWRERLSTEGF